MTTKEQTTLRKKQTELKQAIQSGQYESLVKKLTRDVDWVIRRYTKRAEPLPFWYSLIIIYALVFVLGSIIALARQEFHLSLKVSLLRLSISGFTLAFVLTLEAYIGLLLTVMRQHIIGAIKTTANVIDCQARINSAFSHWKQALFGIVFSLGTTVVAAYGVSPALRSVDLEIGFVVSALVLNFLAGSYFYYMLHLPALVSISEYQFDLYDQDPANSELIEHLGDALNLGLFLVGMGAAIITFILAIFQVFTLVSNLVIAVFVWWIPALFFFITNQYVLAQIIKRGKWEALGQIQDQIKVLHNEADLTDKEAIEAIGRLMDYHARIKDTSNSAINIRMRLGLLNSLLLPLFGSLLGNLERILGFFS